MRGGSLYRLQFTGEIGWVHTHRFSVWPLICKGQAVAPQEDVKIRIDPSCKRLLPPGYYELKSGYNYKCDLLSEFLYTKTTLLGFRPPGRREHLVAGSGTLCHSI